MPRTYSQTINAAQIYNLSSTNTAVNGALTLTARYTVGFLTVDGVYSLEKGANSPSAVLTVPISTSIASLLTQLKALVASQESLDLSAGDSVTFKL